MPKNSETKLRRFRVLFWLKLWIWKRKQRRRPWKKWRKIHLNKSPQMKKKNQNKRRHENLTNLEKKLKKKRKIKTLKKLILKFLCPMKLEILVHLQNSTWLNFRGPNENLSQRINQWRRRFKRKMSKRRKPKIRTKRPWLKNKSKIRLKMKRLKKRPKVSPMRKKSEIKK